MCAIELNNHELYNPGEMIIDPYILLHLMEIVSDFEKPTQPDPQKVPHFFFISTSLIYTVCQEVITEEVLGGV